MTIGFLFWLLMILWFLFALGAVWWESPYRWRLLGASGLLLFILLFLLGWAVFGFVIQGPGPPMHHP